MFAVIARFDVRFRWLIVAAWAAVAVVVTLLLPSLSSVTQANNAQFLPSSAPSVRAQALAAPFQGTASASGTAIIVASRSDAPLTPTDRAAITRAEQAARTVPGVTLVRPAATSPDGEVSEALVTTAPSVAAAGSGSAATVVDSIRAGFARAGAPPGLTFRLTGPLAVSVDSAPGSGGTIAKFTVLFVIALLFLVYRALLAPLITLVPAAVSVLVAGPLIAEAGRAGLPVSFVAATLLTVLLIGAGADYGLFLSFRVREEITAGREPREALVTAVTRVGEAISYSGLTVALALLALLFAPFGIYRGLGPSLAIGIAVAITASLTLTPALLAIFGRAAFWPSLRKQRLSKQSLTKPDPRRAPQRAPKRAPLWGRVAGRVVRHPVATLTVAVVLFGALAAGLSGYRTSGLTGSAPAGSDSAAGQSVIAAHFPQATVGSDQLLLRYATPVTHDPALLAAAAQRIGASDVFSSVSHPLISPDGRTVQFYGALRAGPAGSTAAAGAIPAARAALDAAARATGAVAHGIAGQDAAAYDIQSSSNESIVIVTPIVLVFVLILLGLLLRSLVAPWYLAATVGLSYLASLGFAMLVFVHLGGSGGLVFVLPLLMFVFTMALGEDYNILVMARIREEAAHEASLPAAITRAIGVTGGTVTSAGIILAGTFGVLGVVGGTSEFRQLGFSVAFGVALDTFFVRTLLVPSIAMLLGRWNWWPSALSRRRSPASDKAAESQVA